MPPQGVQHQACSKSMEGEANGRVMGVCRNSQTWVIGLELKAGELTCNLPIPEQLSLDQRMHMLELGQQVLAD